MEVVPVDCLHSRDSVRKCVIRELRRIGNFMMVSLDPDVHNECLNYFDSTLIGKVTLARGSAHWVNDALRLLLQEIWHPVGHWLFSPIGRGFYHF